MLKSLDLVTDVMPPVLYRQLMNFSRRRSRRWE
jgi:hypothetical protein